MFAHRALAPLFHQEPSRFVKTLDGGKAPYFLEQNWAWALKAAGKVSPSRPPLAYGIDRPRDGLAIVWMRFDEVTTTGEPWHVRFIVRDADPDRANGYVRMFLLEHSEYASELAGKPQALVCESLADGKHRNWATTLAPDDEQGFDAFVIETIRNEPRPAAETEPSK
jgi:hypothetical protein